VKFYELKEKFKHQYTMQMIAGILCIALAGGSVAAYQIQGDALTAAGGSVAAKQRAAAGGKNPVQKADAAESADEKDADTKQNAKQNKTVNKTSSAEDAEKKELTNKLVSMFGKAAKSDETKNQDGKEETVYLITDANGKVKQTIVSSWLKNGSGKAEIKDVTSATDLENVKGNETFTQNGKQITWQADGKDIYYRGTTTKKLPITQKVTYYLNGTEISPQELAGKSGKVTIRFDYENHAKTKADINGKQEQIYVPFTVVSGMVLDEGFQNVRVNNGRILSDGNRIMVLGIAMPGLKESMGVNEKDFDKDVEFPDYVEVTADAKDFSLEMTATAAVTGLLSDSELAKELDLKELDEKMDELTDAIGQLKNGSGDLADGLGTLKDSMGSFADGVTSLQNGVNAYTDGASRLADGIRALNDSSGTLEAGVNTLNASAKTISDGVQKLDSTLNTQMSEQEKAAAQQQAQQAAEAQFRQGSKAYNLIYNSAVQNFKDTLTGESAVQTVQAGIQAGMQAQGLTSDGVVAALAEYYAQNGFTDGSGKTYSPQTCQATIPGTETTYAATFAQAVLNGGLSSALASGITDGIAGQGSQAVGEAVVGACRTAAVQAGAQAAVAGAETAKRQIAAAIETADGDSGYSLVTGSKALSDGTQQLADSIPALKDGIGQLQNGADELAGNNESLRNGVSQLADGTAQISSGVGKLTDGALELKDGLAEFDREAIAKLVDAYHGDVKELAERMKQIVQAGEDYGTLCGAAEGTDATTKFIFRTDAV